MLQLPNNKLLHLLLNELLSKRMFSHIATCSAAPVSITRTSN